jgi:hypothetical protein
LEVEEGWERVVGYELEAAAGVWAFAGSGRWERRSCGRGGHCVYVTFLGTGVEELMG